MFVQSEKFAELHGGRIGEMAVYGQESNYTTWRLCKMNLAVRGIDADIKWNSEGSFHKDELRDLKADFILAKDGFIAKLSSHHRRSAMLAADAIITFLHEAYLEREPDPIKTLEPYERFQASNALIDEYASIRGGDAEDGLLNVVVILPGGDEVPLAIETSRLLFGVDREAYKSVLNACLEARAAAVESAEVE